MKKIIKNHYTCRKAIFKNFLITAALLSPTASYALDTGSLLDLGTISVVSGYEQDIKQAPAVVKVFDREDIDKYGFISLGDALQRVPGFHVSPSSDATATVTSSRGITSRILIMFDGVETATGSVNSFGNLNNIPLFGVERIEIMKGPNSAVFGADAVLGVINLVSSSAAAQDSRAGVVLGNNSTGGVYGLSVGKIGEQRLSLYASHFQSKGLNPTIEIDRQSIIDQQIGTRTSLAPGSADNNRELNEARAIYDINDYLKLRLHYYKQQSLGTGVGFFQALDPDGTSEFSALTSSLNFNKKVGGWLLDADLIYYDINSNADFSLLPNNSLGLFPTGVNQRLVVQEKRAKFQFSAFTEVNKHKIRTGFAYLDSEFVNKADIRNFTFIPGVVFPVPVGQSLEFKDTPAALFQDLDYSLTSAFISDEWNFSNDWILTTGLRIDKFSNIGSTTNPRVALTWNQSVNTTFKLLYGQAFRPPSATNVGSNGFAVALGNRELDPSTLRMLELIAEHRFNSRLEASASFFSYELIDLIGVVPSERSPNGLEFVNLDTRQKGKGFETQITWRPLESISITPSWSYTDNDDESQSNASNRFIPKNLYKLDIDYAVLNNWNVLLTAQHVAGRKRTLTDRRNPVDDYTLVNLGLYKKALVKNLSASLSVSNIFNEDAREPISDVIINDYPVANGRSLNLNFTYQF